MLFCVGLYQFNLEDKYGEGFDFSHLTLSITKMLGDIHLPYRTLGHVGKSLGKALHRLVAAHGNGVFTTVRVVELAILVQGATHVVNLHQ